MRTINRRRYIYFARFGKTNYLQLAVIIILLMTVFFRFQAHERGAFRNPASVNEDFYETYYDYVKPAKNIGILD